MADLILPAMSSDGLTAPFPFSHYESILQGLLDRGDVEFVTYDDFDWEDDYDYKNAYPGEWVRWRQSLANQTRDPKKVYVLIQHDSDSGPQATMEMAALEAKLGVRSSLMVFNKWRGASESGVVSPYPLDWDFMRSLKEAGFTVGYHCNALHNANYDVSRVYEEFLLDCQSFDEKMGNTRFFSPHGGKADPDGKVNASFEYPDETGTKLRWVHNRFSVKFNGYYSDGGLVTRLIKGDPLIDLEAWSKTLVPGRRYRALVHPQYYSNAGFRPIAKATIEWYTAMCEQHLATR